MAYHLFMTEEKFKELLPELSGEKLHGGTDACFYMFQHKFYTIIANDGGRAYLGLILDNKVEDLIKDFNSKFKNIQIEVEFKRKFTEYGNYTIIVSNNFSYHGDRKELCEAVSFFVLSLKFSEEYTGKAKYHMTSPILQFVRNLSPMSAYGDRYEKYCAVEPTIENFLEVHKEVHLHGYGVWSYKMPDLDMFMRMDNPPFMNAVTKTLPNEHYYGTQLMTKIMLRKTTKIRTYKKKEAANV